MKRYFRKRYIPALAFFSLTLVAGQPAKVGMVYRAEAPGSDVTKAVQFGKGTGITRNQPAPANTAFRSQTAADQGKVKRDPPPQSVPIYTSGDTAFRK